MGFWSLIHFALQRKPNWTQLVIQKLFHERKIMGTHHHSIWRQLKPLLFNSRVTGETDSIDGPFADPIS
jgi:hypothetical protein